MYAGHIQANRSNLRPRDRFDRPADLKSGPALRAPDQGILDHERKRRVEVKCLELQLSLEDDGVAEDAIEEQVSALRSQLLAQSATSNGAERDVHSIKSFERHEVAQAKERANERLRSAMGISKDHVEGLAFDREAQAQLKVERVEQRARDFEERKKIEAELQVEREKARKLREEQQAAHRREMDDQRRRHQRELEDVRRADRGRQEDEFRRLDDELDQRRFGRTKRDRSASPPRARSKTPPGFRRTRPRSPSPETAGRSASPVRGEGKNEPVERGRSRTRSPTRSRSPPAERSRSGSRSRSRSDSRSRSLPRRRAKSYSRSRSPSRDRSYSRSRSPPRTRVKRNSSSRSRSRSPEART